jgi:hypothetical protein
MCELQWTLYHTTPEQLYMFSSLAIPELMSTDILCTFSGYKQSTNFLSLQELLINHTLILEMSVWMENVDFNLGGIGFSYLNRGF